MRNLKRLVQRAIRDEQGAEGLEKLLIVAAIVLPLLGLLLFFRREIGEYVRDQWEGVRGDSGDYSDIDNPGF